MHMFVETKRSVWPRSDSCQGARGEKEQYSETRLAKRGQQTPLGCLVLKPHSCLMQFLEEHVLSVPIPCINTWAWKNKLKCTCMIHRLADQPTSWQAACGCEYFVTPTRLALFTDGLKMEPENQDSTSFQEERELSSYLLASSCSPCDRSHKVHPSNSYQLYCLLGTKSSSIFYNINIMYYHKLETCPQTIAETHHFDLSPFQKEETKRSQFLFQMEIFSSRNTQKSFTKLM